MNCEQARGLLEELAVDRGAEVLAAIGHAGECAECQLAMEELARWQGALRGDGEHDQQPQGGWSEFEQRLRQGVRRQGAAWVNWSIGLRRGLAAAAVLLVGFGVFYGGRMSLRTVAPGETVAAAGAPELLSVGDVASGAAAFRQVATVFEDQAGWVVLAGGQSELGLRAGRVAPSAVLTVVRLRMEGPAGASTSADLVMVAGEMATLRIGLTGQREIVWQVSGENGQLSIWTELRDVASRRSLGTLGTTLPLKLDLRGQTVGQIVTGHESYRVSAAMAEVRQPAAIPLSGASL